MTEQSRHSAPRILVLTLFVTMLAMGIVTASQLSRLASGQSNTAPQTSMATGAYFDHTVIIIMEDHGVQDVCAQNPPPCSGANGAPYMAGLANGYAIGSQYLGVNHFSQANYLALLGGDTFGCGNTGCPPVSNPNLVDRLEASGLTWKGYMENQNVASGCDNTYHEPYTLEHNPFHGFTGICASSIQTGDNYLKSLVPNILNSNTFTTQRAALFIVYDEGNGWCPL